MSEQEELVTIAEFTDSTGAEMARQTLADAGINAVLEGQNAADIFPIPAVPAILKVLASHADQAIKILEEAEPQEDSEDLEDEEEQE
jgi:hypothetical protein